MDVNDDELQVVELVKIDPVLLPQPSPLKGFLWLFGLAGLYLLGAFFYVLGIGVSIGISGVMLEPEQLDQAVQQHLSSFNGISGLYTLHFCLLIPIIILISNFKEQSWRITLALNPLSSRTLMIWAAIWLAYQIVFMILNLVVEVPVDEFTQMLSGSKHLGMLITMIILAPILEEFVFRGYLFKAWRQSRLGLNGTLLLTTALFTLMHMGQYNLVNLIQVFALGIILGLAREKTGSLLTSVFIHALNNSFAAFMLLYLGL